MVKVSESEMEVLQRLERIGGKLKELQRLMRTKWEKGTSYTLMERPPSKPLPRASIEILVDEEAPRTPPCIVAGLAGAYVKRAVFTTGGQGFEVGVVYAPPGKVTFSNTGFTVSFRRTTLFSLAGVACIEQMLRRRGRSLFEELGKLVEDGGQAGAMEEVEKVVSLLSSVK